MNKVIDSRLGRDGAEIRRRRECLECGRRFTTRERVEEILPKVIKQRRAARGVRAREADRRRSGRPAQKRPVSADDARAARRSRRARGRRSSARRRSRARWVGERVLDELVQPRHARGRALRVGVPRFPERRGLRRLLRLPARRQARARKAAMTPEAAMRLALACAPARAGTQLPESRPSARWCSAATACSAPAPRATSAGRTPRSSRSGARCAATARARVRGASIAVTLEPCDHHGRTAPCTGLLIEAGLARVLVGHVDPHPTVSGRGLRPAAPRRARGDARRARARVPRAAPRLPVASASAAGPSSRSSSRARSTAASRPRAASRAGSRGPAARALRAPPARPGGRGDGRLRDGARRRSRADGAPRGSRRAPPAAHPGRFRSCAFRRARVSTAAEAGEPGYSARAGRRRRSGAALAAAGARLIEVPRKRGHLDLRRGLRLLAEGRRHRAARRGRRRARCGAACARGWWTSCTGSCRRGCSAATARPRSARWG